MKIIVKKPHGKFCVEEIENNVKEIQKVIGGYFECVPYGKNLIVMDEDGKFKNYEPNITVMHYGTLVGTIFFCGSNNFGMTDVDIEDFEKMTGIKVVKIKKDESKRSARPHSN